MSLMPLRAGRRGAESTATAVRIRYLAVVGAGVKGAKLACESRRLASVAGALSLPLVSAWLRNLRRPFCRPRPACDWAGEDATFQRQRYWTAARRAVSRERTRPAGARGAWHRLGADAGPHRQCPCARKAVGGGSHPADERPARLGAYAQPGGPRGYCARHVGADADGGLPRRNVPARAFRPAQVVFARRALRAVLRRISHQQAAAPPDAAGPLHGDLRPRL